MLVVGGVLLVLMLVLLDSGLWIAMTLAFCGWVGQAFFIDTQPGKNLFSAFWDSKAMLNKPLAARSALFWAVCGVANPRHSGAMAVVRALQPIPNQGAHTREDLFSMALTCRQQHRCQTLTARARVEGCLLHRLSKKTDRKSLTVFNEHRHGAIVFTHALHDFPWHSHA